MKRIRFGVALVAASLALATPAGAKAQPTLRSRTLADGSAIVRGSHMGPRAHYIVECGQHYATEHLKACETHEWAEPHGNFYMPWRVLTGRLGSTGYCDVESPCFLVAFAVDLYGRPIPRAIVAATIVTVGSR